ncbi:hypothetical protein V7S43_006677 [Phytophthora oleae]|uniref:Uncharacterized protein n=1 Tax=Phytophthora oleae TaxID=2107226 RepID=A0ABD3FNV4_9STRA
MAIFWVQSLPFSAPIRREAQDPLCLIPRLERLPIFSTKINLLDISARDRLTDDCSMQLLEGFQAQE